MQERQSLRPRGRTRSSVGQKASFWNPLNSHASESFPCETQLKWQHNQGVMGWGLDMNVLPSRGQWRRPRFFFGVWPILPARGGECLDARWSYGGNISPVECRQIIRHIDCNKAEECRLQQWPLLERGKGWWGLGPLRWERNRLWVVEGKSLFLP